jgi:classical protein kinase C
MQQERVGVMVIDLIKADTPLTSAKISRMLHQLEFKLHVERQYKEGIDKMAKLYLVDGDKKARYARFLFPFFRSFEGLS